jgi:nucleoside phosphorylase
MRKLDHRIPAYFQLDKYKITPEDVTRLVLGCEPNLIRPKVVVMPFWRAEIFSGVAKEITEIVPHHVYQMEYQSQFISLVRSGLGAPQTGDVTLALGCTPCETAIFTGSAGGLRDGLQIGDLLIVEKSLCGDGFSRYLEQEVLPGDVFLQPAGPEWCLMEALKNRAAEACLARSVTLHQGTVFSTDSILAQFYRLDTLADELNCSAIEMETAAFFRAAQLVGIKAGALLQISDLPRQGKSLYAGRTDGDMERRRSIRREVLAQAVLSALLAP